MGAIHPAARRVVLYRTNASDARDYVETAHRMGGHWDGRLRALRFTS